MSKVHQFTLNRIFIFSIGQVGIYVFFGPLSSNLTHISGSCVR